MAGVEKSRFPPDEVGYSSIKFEYFYQVINRDIQYNVNRA